MALVNAFGDIALDASVQAVKAAIEGLFSASFAAESGTPLDAAATFTGQARDSQGKHSRVAATFLADQASAAGGCRIEISADGSTGWTTLASGQNTANAPLQLSAYLTARYWRVVMVNDASAQSSLSITSGQFKA